MLTPTEAADYRRNLIDRGACIDAPDPDAWFPPEPILSGHDTMPEISARRYAYERTARTLCGGCPVKAECLTLALDEEIDLPRSWIHGVRGGLAPWRRYQMIHVIRRAARQAVA